MSSENKNNGLKVAIGILAALLIGAAALFFLKNNELNETKASLNSEIESITSDLEGLKKEYDAKIAENAVLNDDLIKERENLELTLDSLRSSQATVETLMRYKNQFFRMKKERDKLFAENQELQKANNTLTLERDAAISQIEKQEAISDSLSTQVADRDKIIEEASQVTLAGLKGLAIIEKSSGKQMLTDKARRADKLKVCYVVGENKIAEAGDREYYIQVLDANNNVLGENAQVQFGDKVLNYSLKSTFSYNNKALDICEYIAAPKKEFEKGNYFINVFKGSELVSNSSFSLR